MDDINKSKDSNTGDVLITALLPVARTMIRSGLGAGELMRAAKLAYVQAAAEEVTPTGGKVNVSRLAVVTGLTRKEIASLLGRRKKKAPAANPKHRREQRAFRVIHAWGIDPLFLKDDGRPADLEMRGGPGSFVTLVRNYGGDVTPVAVLRELERMQAVTLLRSGKVRLRSRPRNSRTHSQHHLTEFSRLLGDFARTAQQVSAPHDPPLFFGFRDSKVQSQHQAALFQRTFSQRAAALLASIEQWAARQQDNPKPTKSVHSRRKIRVGLGVYLLQDESPVRANRKD